MHQMYFRHLCTKDLANTPLPKYINKKKSIALTNLQIDHFVSDEHWNVAEFEMNLTVNISQEWRIVNREIIHSFISIEPATYLLDFAAYHCTRLHKATNQARDNAFIHQRISNWSRRPIMSSSLFPNNYWNILINGVSNWFLFHSILLFLFLRLERRV